MNGERVDPRPGRDRAPEPDAPDPEGDEPARRPVRARDFIPQLAQRSIAEFIADHCPQYAAAIAYHVLFSLFPLAIVLAAIFGIVVSATGTRADVVDTIVNYIPLSESGDQQLRKLLEGATGNLSALGLVGLVGLVYAASGMMAAIRLALNQAWDVTQFRPFLRGKLIDLALLLVTAVLALCSLGATIAVRTAGHVAGRIGVDLGSGWVGWLLGLIVPLVLGFGVVLFLYRVVPASEVRLADAWPGALLVASIWVVLENLFAVYVEHFGNYNAVYGSLGAVIAFMFFVYLTSLVFLLGAEVASEWPRVRERIARGETPEEGPPLPQQLRGIVKGLWVEQRREGPRPRGEPEERSPERR